MPSPNTSTALITVRNDIPVYLKDNHLVFVVLISIFGIFGNVLTLLKIVFDKAYHRTVFYVIGTIVLTDLVNLCLYLAHANVETMNFQLGNVPCAVFLIVFYGATHSSAAHVVLLFGLRCYMVSEPIKFNEITRRHIFGASAVLWILSACFAVLYYLLRYQSGIQSSTYVIIVFRVYLIIIPTLLIVAFHVRKMHRLKRRSLSKHNVANNIIKMSLVTSVILFAYMSSAILFLLCYILSLNGLQNLERNFLVAAQFAWLINSILSPFIYFIAALRARNCFKGTKTALQDKLCLTRDRQNATTEI